MKLKAMRIDEVENLVGKEVIYEHQIREVTGVHLYISKNGINGVRLHLKGIEGYLRLEEAQFFEIIKMAV